VQRVIFLGLLCLSRLTEYDVNNGVVVGHS
jgi:hypothetical protein